MEFFLNVLIDKNIWHYSKRIPTSYLLCKRPVCYHSTIKTHVRHRIFKLSPLHASVIIHFPEFTEFSKNSAPFRKNWLPLMTEKMTFWLFFAVKVCSHHCDGQYDGQDGSLEKQNEVSSGSVSKEAMPPGFLKISHKTDGGQRRPHRFHVSSPLPGHWIR